MSILSIDSITVTGYVIVKYILYNIQYTFVDKIFLQYYSFYKMSVPMSWNFN